MTRCAEVETSNGHVVLLDLGDWDRLQPLLTAGVRLQSLRTRDTVRVLLRSYNPPQTISLIRALFAPHALFKDGGPLDHRRSNIREAAQTHYGRSETASSTSGLSGRPARPVDFCAPSRRAP